MRGRASGVGPAILAMYRIDTGPGLQSRRAKCDLRVCHFCRLLAADHLQFPLDHMDVVDDLETEAAVNEFICPAGRMSSCSARQCLSASRSPFRSPFLMAVNLMSMCARGCHTARRLLAGVGRDAGGSQSRRYLRWIVNFLRNAQDYTPRCGFAPQRKFAWRSFRCRVVRECEITVFEFRTSLVNGQVFETV
jgi:hypothetical protein